MASSPYFDGCYFDGTYFDASICSGPVTPTLGRHVRSARRGSVFFDELPAPDQTALILLITEADDG